MIIIDIPNFSKTSIIYHQSGWTAGCEHGYEQRCKRGRSQDGALDLRTIGYIQVSNCLMYHIYACWRIQDVNRYNTRRRVGQRLCLHWRFVIEFLILQPGSQNQKGQGRFCDWTEKGDKKKNDSNCSWCVVMLCMKMTYIVWRQLSARKTPPQPGLVGSPRQCRFPMEERI